jgi:hypothetical protein
VRLLSTWEARRRLQSVSNIARAAAKTFCDGCMLRRIVANWASTRREDEKEAPIRRLPPLDRCSYEWRVYETLAYGRKNRCSRMYRVAACWDRAGKLRLAG